MAFWCVDSGEPVQPPFKLRNSKWCSVSSSTLRIFKRLVMALIRLRVCAGWSKALLVIHTTFLEIPCHGSYDIFQSVNNSMIFSNQSITKVLIRLNQCAGLSAPFMFANPWRQVFSRLSPISLTPITNLLAFQQAIIQSYCNWALASRLNILWVLSYWLDSICSF